MRPQRYKPSCDVVNRHPRSLYGSRHRLYRAHHQPHVKVLARASYLRDVPSLKQAGANSVYSGEGEVALAFIEDILSSTA